MGPVPCVPASGAQCTGFQYLLHLFAKCAINKKRNLRYKGRLSSWCAATAKLPAQAAQALRAACEQFLLSQLPSENHVDAAAAAGKLGALPTLGGPMGNDGWERGTPAGDQRQGAVEACDEAHPAPADTLQGTGAAQPGHCLHLHGHVLFGCEVCEHARGERRVLRLGMPAPCISALPLMDVSLLAWCTWSLVTMQRLATRAGAQWGIPPIFAARGPYSRGGGAVFEFGAPTTARNAMRVLRALQLRRAVLLEGSPGVGKTSLIAALAKATSAPGLLFGGLPGSREGLHASC